MSSDDAKFIGHTNFFDTYTKLVHNAGFVMEIFRGVGKFTTIHPTTNNHAVYVIRGDQSVCTLSNIMGMLRDNSGVTWTEEVRKRQGVTCPDCAGHGGTEDLEGNWSACERCEEEGLV